MNKILIIVFCATFQLAAQPGNMASPSNGEKAPKDLKGESFFMDGMKAYMADDYQTAIDNFKYVLEKYDGAAGVNFMLAKSYEKNKQEGLAAQEAQRAFEKDKSNLSIHEYYAEQLIKTKAYRDAESEYKQIIKTNPTDMRGYIGLTNAYLLQDDYKNAIKAYDDLEKNIGINEEISKQKQLLYLKLNKVDEALEEGNKLIEAEPLEPNYIIQQAQLMLNKGKVSEAQKMLENAIESTPNFSEAHVILAEIYRQQGNQKACYKALTAAFENKALSVDTKLKILGSYRQFLKGENKGEILDNLETLTKKIIELDPEEARAYVFLGDIYVQKEAYAVAREAYLKSTDYDKSVFDVWLAIIELDNNLGDTKGLIEHSTLATEYFPNQSFFWYHRGLGNLLEKKYAEAILSFEDAEILAFDNPELLANIATLKGDIYFDTNKYKEAEKSYQEALKIDPNYSSAINNYSYILASQKSNLPKAKEMMEKLISNYPNETNYADTYAWVLFKMDDYEAAEKILSRVVLKTDASALAYEHYGDVLYKMGNKTEAITYWKKAQSKGQNASKLAQKIAQELYIE